MKFDSDAAWSLALSSSPFRHRHVVGMLGAPLAKMYGEPTGEPLPAYLDELVRRIEEAELKAVRVARGRAHG
jgi:hypothetical protein